ncbi:MAG TPA: type II secretion system protein GspK [Gemmataceae bacterium]|nr:type II secretion system protein GspK [Gemmataceae bacterium]
MRRISSSTSFVSTKPASAGPRKGIVLLAVLVVVVLLTLAAYEFSDLMGAEHRAAEGNRRILQAHILADSGVNYAAALLSNPESFTSTLNSNPYNNSAIFQSVIVQPSDQPYRQGRFSIVAGVPPAGTTGTPGQPYVFGVVDESSKINLNALMSMDSSGQIAYNVLMNLPNMTDDVANSIIDWMDPDSTPRTDGAEDDYYSSLTPPYHCKNGPLDSLEELLLVKGMTPQLLFGNDLNRNGILDPEEDDGTGVLDQGWSQYLTVLSREQNVDSQVNPRIYLNNSDLNALYNQLNAVVGPQLATYIVAYRLYGPASGSGSGGGNGNTSAGGNGAGGNGAGNGGGAGGGGGNNPGGMGGSAPPGGGGNGGAGSTRGAGSQAGNTGGAGAGGMTASPGGGAGGAGAGGGAGGAGAGGGRGGAGPGGGAAMAGPTGGGINAGGGSAQGSSSQLSRNSLNTSLSPSQSISSVFQLINSSVNVPAGGSTTVTTNVAVSPNGQSASSTTNSSTTTTTISYPSPLNDPSQLGQLLPLLLDETTTSKKSELPPRINVNTASAAVLATLPGLTESDVQNIVQNQPNYSSGETPDPAYQTTAWLITIANLSTSKVQAVDSYITARSQVYRVQSMGTFDKGGPTARIEAVIDTNGGRPRILSYRDLTDLGRGFDPSQLNP